MFAMEPCTVELTEALELVEEEGRVVFRGWCKTEGSGQRAPRMLFVVEGEEVAESVAATAVRGVRMHIEVGQMSFFEGPDILGRFGLGISLRVSAAWLGCPDSGLRDVL